MTNEEIQNITLESLRDWFKKEKWVRITTSGDIAGPCGTSKNKKNPDRCLPAAKARSLTKAQRAATARKKKKAGAKGKTVVKNTKAATVKKEGLWANINAKKKAGRKPSHGNSNAHKQAEKAGKALKKETANPQDGKAAPYGSGYKKVTKEAMNIKKASTDQLKKIVKQSEDERVSPAFASQLKLIHKELQKRKVTKEDIHNLVVGTIAEMQNENTLSEKDDRCTRIAKRKYDTWPSAYASGAVVRCRRGEIWKGVSEDSLNELKCKHGSYFCPHDKVMKCRKGPKKSRS